MNFEDNATIRNAILRRLDKENNVAIYDLIIEKHKDCIAVGVWTVIADVSEALVDCRSFFDLPLEFTHSHLLNEIDEIAEQIKDARKKIGPYAIYKADTPLHREMVIGTGRRGRWKQEAA